MPRGSIFDLTRFLLQLQHLGSQHRYRHCYGRLSVIWLSVRLSFYGVYIAIIISMYL